MAIDLVGAMDEVVEAVGMAHEGPSPNDVEVVITILEDGVASVNSLAQDVRQSGQGYPRRKCTYGVAVTVPASVLAMTYTARFVVS